MNRTHRVAASQVKRFRSTNTTAAGTGLVLHSFFLSSCSWRVRIALNIKGLAYEYRTVNIIGRSADHQTPSFSALNRIKEVPVLEANGLVIGQSQAILEYLEEAYPAVPLLPTDLGLRAKVRQFSQNIIAGTQPYQNIGCQRRLPADMRADWVQYWLTRGLDSCEVLAQQYAGKYSIGDAVTIADLCLVPQLFHARRNKVDVSGFNKLLEVESSLVDLPAFRAAHPDAQPDAPAPAPVAEDG